MNRIAHVADVGCVKGVDHRTGFDKALSLTIGLAGWAWGRPPGRLARVKGVSMGSEQQENQQDCKEYVGKEHLLAEATRKLTETFSVTFKLARFKFQGDNAPTVEEYMLEAARAFDEKRGSDAWWCLKAVEVICNQEGQARQYGLRIKQLRRGTHTAPMAVSQKTLKGSRFVPLYTDAKMTTKFFSCGNRSCPGFHLGLRQTNEALALFADGPCPGKCGGKIQPHVLTISEQIKLMNG